MFEPQTGKVSWFQHKVGVWKCGFVSQLKAWFVKTFSLDTHHLDNFSTKYVYYATNIVENFELMKIMHNAAVQHMLTTKSDVSTQYSDNIWDVLCCNNEIQLSLWGQYKKIIILIFQQCFLQSDYYLYAGRGSVMHHNNSPLPILTYSKVPLLWVMNNMLNYQNWNVNILISSSYSLAEELYQKVKRLFGDPHQATEDLKAEVIISSNLLPANALN